METKVEVKLSGEDRFEVTTLTNEVRFYVDKKKENYTPQGPNPLELFLSSLGSCVGVYALRYLNNHAITFEELTVKVKAEFSEAAPARLINIQVSVFTDADILDKREVFLRFIRNCPIHNTILHSKEIDITLS